MNQHLILCTPQSSIRELAAVHQMAVLHWRQATARQKGVVIINEPSCPRREEVSIIMTSDSGGKKMQETKARTTKKHVALSAMLALMLSLMMMVPAMAFGATAQVDYISHTIVPSSTPGNQDATQTVTVTLEYKDTVTVTDPVAILTDLVITVGGSSIDPSRLTVTPSGDDLIIAIGPDPSFTAVYNAEIIISTPKGVHLQVGGVDVDNVDFDSIVPLGIGTTSTPGVGEATLKINSQAQIRGMFYVGLYIESGSDLNPQAVNPSAGGFGVYVYTSHDHDFYTTNPDAIAKTIVSDIQSAGLATGYSVGIDSSDPSGTTILFTGPSNQTLHIYLFDDNLLNESGISFPDARTAGGVIPIL